MFFPKYMTAFLRCSGTVCCCSLTSRYQGCLFMLPVSYLLFDLCSLSLVAYIVLFCCKNNLFEFYFLVHGDWCFCHTSLYCYCFPLCLVSSLVGICVAGVEYQTYIMTTDLLHQMLCSNLTAAISWIIFESHTQLSDLFVVCGIPASFLRVSLFFLSLLYIPCCHTWLLWVCQIFASFSYDTRTLFSHCDVSFIWREMERYLAKSTIPQEYRAAQRVITMAWRDVNFDLSFTISLPFLPLISK